MIFDIFGFIIGIIIGGYIGFKILSVIAHYRIQYKDREEMPKQSNAKLSKDEQKIYDSL